MVLGGPKAPPSVAMEPPFRAARHGPPEQWVSYGQDRRHRDQRPPAPSDEARHPDRDGLELGEPFPDALRRLLEVVTGKSWDAARRRTHSAQGGFAMESAGLGGWRKAQFAQG